MEGSMKKPMKQSIKLQPIKIEQFRLPLTQNHNQSSLKMNSPKCLHIVLQIKQLLSWIQSIFLMKFSHLSDYLMKIKSESSVHATVEIFIKNYASMLNVTILRYTAIMTHAQHITNMMIVSPSTFNPSSNKLITSKIKKLSFFKNQKTQITIKNRIKNDGKILIKNSESVSKIGPNKPLHHPLRELLLILLM